IPTPPTDQWAQLPVEVTQTEDPSEVAGALEDGDLVELLAPTVPEHGEPGRTEALEELDGAVAAALEELGGCDSADFPRTLLVSVAAPDPEDPADGERTGAVASRSAGLQVAVDTALPGEALTSGATKQTGIVVLTDVLA